jgi:hypothetical protein
MKKLFLLSMLFLSMNLFAQNAYYDALTISKYVVGDKLSTDSVSKAEYAKILNNYLINPKTTFTVNTIFNDYRVPASPNFNPFFIGILPVEGAGAAFGNLLSKKSGGLLPFIGGLDVTNIADGLAQFLIKRGKQELNIAFFQKMKDFLEDNVEARTLFPATSVFLGNIDAYRYSELLQSLRESFYKDISNLIVNLNLLIDLPKYQVLLKALPEIRVAIRSVKIISELSQPDSSIHPANLISHFAALKEWGEMNINLKSSWKALDEISKSVRRVEFKIDSTIRVDTTRLTRDTFSLKVTRQSDNVIKIDTVRISRINTFRIDSVRIQQYDTVKNNKIAWIKFLDFNENILKDTVTLKIYLGLLYQRMAGISFRYSPAKDTSVQQFMKDNSTNILRLADLVENFLVLANDVEQSIKDIRNKEVNDDDYYTYIEKAINVVDYGFKVANTIKEGLVNDRYISIARNANNLYKNIYTKNYNAAVMNGYLIFDEVFTNSKAALKDKRDFFNTLKDPNSSLSQKTVNRNLLLNDTINFDYSNTALNASNFSDEKKENERTRLFKSILKYGNMMASIVKAENSEDAEAAIEAAALPAGSSSIKKNSAVNISLNAYLGGYFGRSANNTDEIDGNGSKVGVTAPVGIAFSLGLGHYPNRSPIGSISLLGTLIDVGAIAGYRLNKDSTTLDQKITLNDIFTPGGYLVYGIGLPFKGFSYVPISLGYGLQYGSRLYYKKNDDKLAISDKSRWRSNWFIGIDIPLANFTTKAYKSKN